MFNSMSNVSIYKCFSIISLASEAEKKARALFLFVCSTYAILRYFGSCSGVSTPKQKLFLFASLISLIHLQIPLRQTLNVGRKS